MTDESGPIIGSGANWTGGAKETAVVTFEVSFPNITASSVVFDVTDEDEPEDVAHNLKKEWDKKYPTNPSEATIHNKVIVQFKRNGVPQKEMWVTGTKTCGKVTVDSAPKLVVAGLSVKKVNV